MKRTCCWIAVCVGMWSGVEAMGQPGPYPYGVPGGYQPALPNLPYGPALPNLPYGPIPPVPPMAPFAYPNPGAAPYAPNAPSVPADPRLPVRPRPGPAPTFQGNGTNPGAAEPYLVQPDGPSSGKPQPEAKPGNIVTEPFNRLVDFVTGPSEPYTTYEGHRYRAEEKEDNTRFWVRANYIHWWIRPDVTPPLVTTGDPTLPNAGAFGGPNTTVLLGNGSISPQQVNGMQMTFGMWLDPERIQSVEVGGFWLGRVSQQYGFASDGNGNMLFGQPVNIVNPPLGESLLATAQPGVFAGRMAVDTQVDFFGLELNLARNIFRLNGWSLDSLIGARYLYLNDALTINQNVTVLPAAAGFIPFNGVPQPAGSNFLFNDSFAVTNRFYGGTIGARLDYACCRFDVSAALKLSLGATAHVANINGSTTLNGMTTVPGGSLAQASNIGQFNSTDFSVVPEFNLNFGYQVTSHLRLIFGYTVLDWNRIERAGAQIDRQIDFTQVPTSPVLAPGTVGTHPIFPANRTDFWAQGINVGMEFKY